jgi:hypothetical protein
LTPEQMAFDAAAIPTIIANVKTLKGYLPKGPNAKRWAILLPVAGFAACGLAAGARHTAEAIQKPKT